MKLDHIQNITKYSTHTVHCYLLYIISSGSIVITHFFFVLNLSLFYSDAFFLLNAMDVLMLLVRF